MVAKEQDIYTNLVEIFKKYQTATFSVAMSLLILFSWLHYKRIVSNEILVLVSPQKVHSPQEVSFSSGDTFTINYHCQGDAANRWMLYLTTASNHNNDGLLTISLDDSAPKTFRTRFFTKMAGVYEIPLPKKSDKLLGRVSLKLTLSHGNKSEPMLYVPVNAIDKPHDYQISLQPEKSKPFELAANVVYPISLKGFEKSGWCEHID